MPKLLVIWVVVLTGAVTAQVAGGRAADVPTCAYDGGTHSVSVGVARVGSTNLLRVGNAITVNGVACGGATVTNTDTITLHANKKQTDDNVSIDLRGGYFAPGATPEASGTSEIEIVSDLGGDGGDTIIVYGSDGPDTLVAGSSGAALNGDGDADVIPVGPTPRWRMFGGGGNDVVRRDGGFGTGTPVTRDGEARGDDGDDLVVGGPGKDRLTDGLGSDVVQGGGSGDVITLNGGGHDVVDAGPGNDTITAQGVNGGSVSDLAGGSGIDTFDVAQGTVDHIDGGSSTDTAHIDRALDTTVNVETITP
jgi:hypothetical protein